MNSQEERIPKEGLDILADLDSYLKNQKKIKEELAHIKKPYCVPDIWRQYLSGSYNAELLLQHCLTHLHIP
jgi:hypothetical protein